MLSCATSSPTALPPACCDSPCQGSWTGCGLLHSADSRACTALQVCGIVSVGAVEGIAHVNWRLLRLYLAQWVLTIPAVGLMTAAVFLYGVQYLAGMYELLLDWCSQSRCCYVPTLELLRL